MDNHGTDALVVTCIDYRLQEAINNWLSQNFAPKTFDRVALAGGVKNLETILGQIDIAVRLHHVKDETDLLTIRVILITIGKGR